jgi:hypothetical protein
MIDVHVVQTVALERQIYSMWIELATDAAEHDGALRSWKRAMERVEDVYGNEQDPGGPSEWRVHEKMVISSLKAYAPTRLTLARLLERGFGIVEDRRTETFFKGLAFCTASVKAEANRFGCHQEPHNDFVARVIRGYGLPPRHRNTSQQWQTMRPNCEKCVVFITQMNTHMGPPFVLYK